MTCVRCEPYDKVGLGEFVPHVNMFVKNAPIDFIKHHIRTAIIELTSRTHILKRDIYVDAQCGVQDYDLVLEDGYVIRAISSVVFNGIRLTRSDSTGAPYGCQYYFDRPCKLLIGLEPNEDCKENIEAAVVVSPTHSSCDFDRWLYDYYAEDIALGAMSRLMLVKESDWYDPRQGGIMQKRWQAVLARAKVEKSKNYSTEASYIKVPRWI